MLLIRAGLRDRRKHFTKSNGGKPYNRDSLLTFGVNPKYGMVSNAETVLVRTLTPSCFYWSSFSCSSATQRLQAYKSCLYA